MKESFDEFENELRRLTPLQPPEELTTRIAAKLEGPQAKNRILPILSLSWAALTAAMLVGVLALWHSFTPGNVPVQNQPGLVSLTDQAVEEGIEMDQFRPVDYAEYLYGAQEEEVIYLDESSPVIPVRLFYLDTTVWENETRQIAFEMTVPREEIVLLPLQIF
jgi:hypothetical protein